MIAVAAVVAWHRHRIQWPSQAPWLALPDLKGKPGVLARLLSDAQDIAKSSPHPIESVAELGLLYQANGYGAQAEACWRWLREQQPNNAHWCYYLAELRRAASDYPAMVALLRQTTELAPDYAPAWLKLAEWELKTGQTDAAARDYRRRIVLLPNDPYAFLGLARVARQNGQNDEARQLVGQLVRDHPDLPSAHNLYAEMLAAEGDETAALRERQRGRTAGRFREADDPWLSELDARCYDFNRLAILAAVQYQTASADRGEALLKRIVQIAPDNPTSYELLGGLYLNLGNAAEARATFEQGLERKLSSKPSALYYFQLSDAWRQLKRPARALAVAEEGLHLFSSAIELNNAAGIALSDLGRNDEAIVAFQSALKLNPNDTNSNFNLARALLSLDRRDEAIAHLERSLVQQPTFPDALSLLGRLELESDHLELAGRYLKRLYDSNPQAPAARQLMAEWHLRSGLIADKQQDSRSAERHYITGIELDPNASELYIRLGTLCLVQDRFTDALKPLEIFHHQQPNDPQGYLYLGQDYTKLGRIADARRILSEGVQVADHAGRSSTAAHCQTLLAQLPE